MSKKNKDGKKKGTDEKHAFDHRLPLEEVIASLRSGLKQARADGKEEDIRLLVQEAEVELQFGVTKGVEGKVGVNFWVYSAEGGPKLEQEAVQTIRLKLQPKYENEDLLIDNEGQTRG